MCVSHAWPSLLCCHTHKLLPPSWLSPMATSQPISGSLPEHLTLPVRGLNFSRLEPPTQSPQEQRSRVPLAEPQEKGEAPQGTSCTSLLWGGGYQSHQVDTQSKRARNSLCASGRVAAVTQALQPAICHCWLKTLNHPSRRRLRKLCCQARQQQEAAGPGRQLHVKVVCSQGTETTVSSAREGQRHNNSQHLTQDKVPRAALPPTKEVSPPHSCSVGSCVRAVTTEQFGVGVSWLESVWSF